MSTDLNDSDVVRVRKVSAPVRIDFAGGWTDVPMWAEKYGGFVMNAAINHFVSGMLTSDPERGTKVEYHCDLPTGSGLGTSAAMNVVLVTLLRSETNIEHKVAQEIAEQAYEFESLLGVRGGRQDQYAAAFGYFSALTFTTSFALL